MVSAGQAVPVNSLLSHIFQWMHLLLFTCPYWLSVGHVQSTAGTLKAHWGLKFSLWGHQLDICRVLQEHYSAFYINIFIALI